VLRVALPLAVDEEAAGVLGAKPASASASAPSDADASSARSCARVGAVGVLMSKKERPGYECGRWMCEARRGAVEAAESDEARNEEMSREKGTGDDAECATLRCERSRGSDCGGSEGRCASLKRHRAQWCARPHAQPYSRELSHAVETPGPGQ
jgi:hypothetical protein